MLHDWIWDSVGATDVIAAIYTAMMPDASAPKEATSAADDVSVLRYSPAAAEAVVAVACIRAVNRAPTATTSAWAASTAAADG